MERPEIIEGLKHAIDRGYSLDIAVSSFINAGYNRQDVIDSSRKLSGSVLAPDLNPVMQPPKAPITQNINQQPQRITEQLPPQPRAIMQNSQPVIQQPIPKIMPKINQPIQPEKKGHGLIIFLVTLLIFLIGALAAVILAKDAILGWFS